jgi:integration host factor subunit beta
VVRSDLIAALVADGVELATARASIDCLAQTIAHHLGDGGRVELRNFGSFSVRSHTPKPRRNPGTGETNGVVTTRRVYFRPSVNLANTVARMARTAGDEQ